MQKTSKISEFKAFFDTFSTCNESIWKHMHRVPLIFLSGTYHIHFICYTFKFSDPPKSKIRIWLSNAGPKFNVSTFDFGRARVIKTLNCHNSGNFCLIGQIFSQKEENIEFLQMIQKSKHLHGYFSIYWKSKSKTRTCAQNMWLVSGMFMLKAIILHFLFIRLTTIHIIMSKYHHVVIAKTNNQSPIGLSRLRDLALVRVMS